MKKIYVSCSTEAAPEGFEKVTEEQLFTIEDNSVDEIFLIGIYDKTKCPKILMSEVHRLLIIGGKCTLVCPYYASIEAWMDPRSVRGVSELSLNWTNKAWRDSTKWTDIPDLNYDIQTGISYAPEWNLRAEEAKVQAQNRNINVIKTIQFVLVKK